MYTLYHTIDEFLSEEKHDRKNGDYIEVSIPTNASYHVVCREAAETLHMESPYGYFV